MFGLTSFDPLTLVLIALLNPVVVVVAVMMGRAADQWQKLIVAAFAASLAGVLGLYLAEAVGLVSVRAVGGEGGLLVMQFFVGLAWSTLAYRLFPNRQHGS
jgi:hypothetical protein